MERWKRRFTILLAANLAVVVGLAVLVLWNAPDRDHSFQGSVVAEESAVFRISTTKQDLNEAMNAYLRNKASGQIDYTVTIEDDVVLTGDITMFGRTIQMQMTFAPVVLENGDMELHASAMRVGRLPLPMSKVLLYVRNYYSIPEWVVIKPDDRSVIVHLSRMSANNGARLKALEFDPQADRFAFELLYPTGQPGN